jgi:hypothetical protein
MGLRGPRYCPARSMSVDAIKKARKPPLDEPPPHLHRNKKAMQHGDLTRTRSARTSRSSLVHWLPANARRSSPVNWWPAHARRNSPEHWRPAGSRHRLRAPNSPYRGHPTSVGACVMGSLSPYGVVATSGSARNSATASAPPDLIFNFSDVYA